MTFRSVFAILFLLGLAACAGTSEPPPPRVAVWQGEQSGRLFMRVLADQPLRDARLLTPEGRQILTERVTQPEGSGSIPYDNSWNRPTFGIGGAAGSSGGFGTGVGVSFPVGGGGTSRAPVAQSSQVEFALSPEQIAQYRSRTRDWTLELQFDRGIASMPAPALVP